jgi:hypothetical protein
MRDDGNVADTPTGQSPGRQVLDLALGVLIALEGGNAKSAFSELIDVSRRWSLSPFALSAALVACASRSAVVALGANAIAERAVRQEWGDLLALRA